MMGLFRWYACVIVAPLSACALTHAPRPTDAALIDRGDALSDVADAMDMVDVPPPDGADVLDATDAPDAPDVPDARDVPDVPDAPPVVLNVDFTTAMGGPLATLPGGLMLTRASPATVQTSETTVVTMGIGPNVARVGRHSASVPLALVFEEQRTNLLPDSRAYDSSGASWMQRDARITMNAGAGPDGQALAERVQAMMGEEGPRWLSSLATGTYTLTTWQRATMTSSPYAVRLANGGGPTLVGSVGPDWTRLRQTTMLPPNHVVSLTINPPSPADLLVDMAQDELGSFPTEFVLTSGATARREGERLFYPGAAALVDAGRLSIEFRLRPKGAIGEYPGTIRVWTAGSDYCEINPVTGVVTVRIGGSTNTTTAMDWSALEPVDLWVSAGTGMTVIEYRRSNMDPATTLGVVGGPLPALTPSGDLDLLCNGTNNQFTSWVEHIITYRGSARPTWAR